MAEKTLNLRGPQCLLPTLRMRKVLYGLPADGILVVECTTLVTIDIPKLLRQTGNTLEDARPG
jgi:TusA-related sulfurtransferase